MVEVKANEVEGVGGDKAEVVSVLQKVGGEYLHPDNMTDGTHQAVNPGKVFLQITSLFAGDEHALDIELEGMDGVDEGARCVG